MKKIDHYFKRKPPPEPEQCSSTSSSLISTKWSSESASDSPTSTNSTVSSYDPPYPDIGKIKENDLSNHEFKTGILQRTWDPNLYNNYSFPAR